MMEAEKHGPFWSAPELASAGYPVFPISPQTKRPSVTGGFYAATTDHSEIAAWISDDNREDHLIAFATGALSGVVVIDADSVEAAEKMREEFGKEHVSTRRGGHWYFKHPKTGKVMSHAVGEHLDCKGDGGYVLAPPGGGKTWTAGIPQRSSLPKLPEKFNDRPALKIVGGEDVESRLESKAAELMAGYVSQIEQGRHDHLLAFCGTLMGRGVSTDSVEKIAVGAWLKVGGDLTERAEREVRGAVEATQENISTANPVSGRGRLEEITPGFYDDLAALFSWQEGKIEVGSHRVDGSGNKQRIVRGPSHGVYRDHFLDIYPHVYFSRGDWYSYSEGYYGVMHEEKVKRDINKIIELDPKAKLTSSVTSSVFALIRAERYVDADTWNPDPALLVLKNGTLNVETREFRVHSPADMVTHAVEYNYDPAAKAKNFKLALSIFSEDEEQFIREYMGLCLTPDTKYEKALWLLGYPGAGKSTIIQAFQTLLGEKVGSLGLDQLIQSRFALGGVVGKNLLISGEQPAAHLSATSTLDSLLSGEMIQIERKNRDPEDVIPTAKLLWAMNDLPRITNTTSGLFRRVEIVEMPVIPESEREEDLKSRIAEEGPGLLNMALDGLQSLRERGRFKRPQSMLERSEDFQRSNDLPAQFLDERCVRDPQASVNGRTLYNEYAEWCREGGNTPVAINRLGNDWRRLGLKQSREGNYGPRIWSGIRLKITSDYGS